MRTIIVTVVPAMAALLTLLILSACSVPETKINRVEITTNEVEKDTWSVTMTLRINAPSRADALKQASSIILGYSKEIPPPQNVTPEDPKTVKPEEEKK